MINCIVFSLLQFSCSEFNFLNWKILIHSYVCFTQPVLKRQLSCCCSCSLHFVPNWPWADPMDMNCYCIFFLSMSAKLYSYCCRLDFLDKLRRIDGLSTAATCSCAEEILSQIQQQTRLSRISLNSEGLFWNTELLMQIAAVYTYVPLRNV